MSLFKRRQIQAFIYDLDGVVPRHKIEYIVDRLNKEFEGSLAFEWELVLLWALTRNFRVDYEFGGRNDPKVDFRLYKSDEAEPFCMAEVSAISDEGRHKENPIDLFSKAVAAAHVASGVQGTVNADVKAFDIGEGWRKRKVKLSLPKRNDTAAWQALQQRITDYLMNWKRGPQIPLDLSDIAAGASLSFAPGNSFTSLIGFQAYTANYSETLNPVANRIDEKHEGLKRHKVLHGAVGLILCDAGCRQLGQTNDNGESVSLQTTVTKFLEGEKNTLVDFVLVLAIESKAAHPNLGIDASHKIKSQFFCKASAKAKCDDARDALNWMLEHVPDPETSGENAKNFYVGGNARKSWRDYLMTLKGYDKIAVSSRWLLEAMEEKFNREEERSQNRAKRMGIGRTPEANPFTRMREQERMPVNISISNEQQLDDDSIEIEFGKPDAAVGKFLMPEPKK